MHFLVSWRSEAEEEVNQSEGRDEILSDNVKFSWGGYILASFVFIYASGSR